MLADGEVEDELTNQHRLELIKIYPIGQLAFSSNVNKYNHLIDTDWSTRLPLHHQQAQSISVGFINSNGIHVRLPLISL